MDESANFLAVDLGASSGRVLLGQWDGARFALRELHRFANGGVRVQESVHWDVLRLWQELKDGLARYAAEFDAPLAGIGVDAWGVDFALLDRAGHLLGNPYHYRDARTAGVPERVFARVPRREVFARTGIQFMPINTLYQLYSMAQVDDPQLAAAETLLLIPDLFGYWLTGRKVAEYTNATTTQCFDCHERRWAADLLARLDLPPQILPPVVEPGALLGELRPEVVDEVRLRHAVPVFAPATHDTASAVAAVPGLDARSAYVSSGTWSLLGVELPAPVVGDAALARNFTNEGGVGGTIRLLKNITGLWLLQECQRQWQREGRRFGWDELLAAAEAAAPRRSLVDPDAVEFLNPDDMPAALRAWCRRTGQPEPDSVGAVVRCCLESIALKHRWVLEALEELVGHRIETLRVVGGGSQNALLCRLLADACQRAVVAGPVEATALGNVLVQTVASGHLPDLAAGRRAIAASVALTAYEPDPRSARVWDDVHARFVELLPEAAG